MTSHPIYNTDAMLLSMYSLMSWIVVFMI